MLYCISLAELASYYIKQPSIHPGTDFSNRHISAYIIIKFKLIRKLLTFVTHPHQKLI